MPLVLTSRGRACAWRDDLSRPTMREISRVTPWQVDHTSHFLHRMQSCQHEDRQRMHVTRSPALRPRNVSRLAAHTIQDEFRKQIQNFQTTFIHLSFGQSLLLLFLSSTRNRAMKRTREGGPSSSASAHHHVPPPSSSSAFLPPTAPRPPSHLRVTRPPQPRRETSARTTPTPTNNPLLYGMSHSAGSDSYRRSLSAASPASSSQSRGARVDESLLTGTCRTIRQYDTLEQVGEGTYGVVCTDLPCFPLCVLINFKPSVSLFSIFFST